MIKDPGVKALKLLLWRLNIDAEDLDLRPDAFPTARVADTIAQTMAHRAIDACSGNLRPGEDLLAGDILDDMKGGL